MGIPAALLTGISDLNLDGLRELQSAISKARPLKRQKKKEKNMLDACSDGTAIEVDDTFFLGGPPEEVNFNVANYLRGDHEAIDRERDEHKKMTMRELYGVAIVLADWSSAKAYRVTRRTDTRNGGFFARVKSLAQRGHRECSGVESNGLGQKPR